MTETALKEILDKISKSRHKYCGILDENGFRMGSGCHQWYNETAFQKYTGQFLYNNLHGKGTYLTDIKGDETYFEGLFYANKLEGYGKVIYSNGSKFEGLFKHHNRFGPGVFTYPDDSQDVGLWENFSLIRLSVVIGGDFVPRLGGTSLGKARLLKFRNLVPICFESVDKAKEILSELGASEEVLAESDQLYNLHIRNPSSLFFDKNRYDDNFVEQDCTIEVLLSREEFEEEASCLEETNQEDSEDLPKEESRTCSCFQENLDRFTNICVQLHEIELKLEKLATKKKHLEEQKRTCEQCCHNIMALKRRTHEMKNGSIINRQESLKNTILEDESFMEEMSGVLENTALAFFANPEDEQSEMFTPISSKSEIVLQNYFYSNSVTSYEDSIAKRSDNSFNIDEERLSRLTLPFSTQLRDTDISTNIMPLPTASSFSSYSHDSIIEEEDEITQYQTEIGSQTCQCNDMLLENYNAITKKLEALNKEVIFYSTIKKSLKTQLDLEFHKVNEMSQEETRFVKRVPVSDLLAWNNEKIWTVMLQHCFRHRTSESNVTFNVTDLLTGHRSYFKQAGTHESFCKQFLESCYKGHDRNVFQYFRNYNINPDICDVKGNTGMMLATIKDKAHMIEALVKYGGKIDAMNDEGLTPLTMSFLKYLSFKHQVHNWEKGFLEDPKMNLGRFGTRQWLPSDSIINFRAHTDTENKSPPNSVGGIQVALDGSLKDTLLQLSVDKKLSDINITLPSFDEDLDTLLVFTCSDKEQKYVFNTEYVKLPRKAGKNKVKKGSKKKRKKTKTEMTTDTNAGKNNHNSQGLKADRLCKKMDIIKSTILTLLEYGSDPNIGEVPMRSLFLAVFTDNSDLLRSLLEHHADPNITNDKNLTCLHVIASLELTVDKVRMCHILLQFKANPNLKTSKQHWKVLKREIIGEGFNEIDMVDNGKNALHLLSLREDFVHDALNHRGEMAKILVNHGCKSDLYLGHTPLSLAVLRGNTQLIKSLLKTGRVNPHQLLGYGMGNALTVLILKRFSLDLSGDVKKEIIDTLLDHGLNPLSEVGEFENSVAFIENEESLVVPGKIRSKIGKKRKEKKAKKKSKSSKKKSSKKSKKNKKKLESMESYIKDETRKVLFKHIQSKAVEYLYNLITETIFADPLIVILAKYVTPEETLKYLKSLFKNGIISLDRFSHVVIADLLEFVKLQHSFDKIPGDKDREELEEKVRSMPWHEVTHQSKKVYPGPEVDRDEDKYKVCFQCLKGRGKRLLTCPSCEMIYFCSEECNVLNDATCPYHHCKILFYEAVNDIVREEQQPSRLSILLEMASKVRAERIAVFKFKTLQEKLSKLRFKTPTMKKKVDELLHTFVKVRQEKEDFGKRNNIWNFSQIYERLLKSDDGIHKKKSKERSGHDLVQESSHMYREYSGIICSTISEVACKTQITSSTRFGSVISPDVCSYDPFTVKSDLQVSAATHHSKDRLPSTTNTKAGPNTEILQFDPKPRQLAHFEHASESEKTTSTKRKNLTKKHDDKIMTRHRSGNSTMFDPTEQVNLAFNKAKSLPHTFGSSNGDRFQVDKNQESPKKVPNKQYYMELLSKIFADFNLPLLLLPYACYKDGQVYYSMCDNVYFGKSFQKLNIPN